MQNKILFSEYEWNSDQLSNWIRYDLELPNIAKIVKTKSLTGKDLPRLANKEDYFIIEVTEIKEINKLKLFREKLILSIFFGDIKSL